MQLCLTTGCPEGRLLLSLDVLVGAFSVGGLFGPRVSSERRTPARSPGRGLGTEPRGLTAGMLWRNDEHDQANSLEAA